MLAFSALVAGSFSLGSMAANEIAPAAINTARFAIAGVVIGVAAVLSGRLTRAAFRAPWRYLVLGGLFAVYFVLMFEGLKTANPVSAAAVFTLTPVMAAGFGWLLMRQITTRWMAPALAIGASGALWVIFRADLEALLRFRTRPRLTWSGRITCAADPFAFEKPFERVEIDRFEQAEPLNPDRRRTHGIGFETAPLHPPAFVLADETCAGQDGEVLGNRGQRHLERFGHVGHRHVVFQQHRQDAAARGVGQSGEDGVKVGVHAPSLRQSRPVSSTIRLNMPRSPDRGPAGVRRIGMGPSSSENIKQKQ